jgi:NTP pyrophosphatase (non-canonical NTP hydrolase)
MKIQELQKEIYQNKVNRGFNTTDVGKEIILMTEELGELAKAYKKENKEELIDAIGDLMVYCLGLCEILKVDCEEVLKQIVENNKKREHKGYMKKDGQQL